MEQLELMQFEDVTLGYGKKEILSRMSFRLLAKDFIGIVGPNGSGKTTLLRAILGNLKPLGGRIIRSESGASIRFGYVPQRDHLEQIFPLTVLEVVQMGMYRQIGLGRYPGKSDVAFALECLNHVGITSLEKILFKNLSGGQKQRTLIARALATRPTVLVLDEPTNGMDILSQKSILSLIKELHERDGLTILMVSHLLTEVSNHVEKIILVEANNFQVGTVAEILTNANLSRIYNTPFTVESIHGQYLISVGENQ